MNQLLSYLLQIIVASGLLYGYYHFALRNKRFHRYNRFYLLMAVIISSLIPFLNIPVYFSGNETSYSTVLETLQVISSPIVNEPVATVLTTENRQPTLFTAERCIYLIYCLILSFFIVRIIISLNKIRYIIKRNPVEQIDKIKFVNTEEPGTPFSFFRWLFWNKKLELHSDKGEQIFRHELFHIQQKHSWDIIFIELVSTIFWINPFFHLIKRELRAIHEFLADEFAIKENKHWQYAELLLMQVLNTNNRLVNPFFHNQIKRRIAMITTSTKPSYQYLRKVMALPIAVIVLFLFAFNIKNKKSTEPNEFKKANNSITVVIDAGHGGTDAGAKTKDGKYNEAQLTLEIAKKIETLAHEYNVNVIMTRQDEKFPGGVTNKNDALRKRVDIVNKVKPDAFIAIHMNSTAVAEQNSKSGFDGYVTKQRYNHPDIQLATAILSELKSVYKTRQEIRQRDDMEIFVLDKPNHPSFLLECGYINNQQDLSFITNKRNQENIARAILKGVVAFVNTDPTTRQFYFQSNADTSKLLNNALIIINGVIQEKRGIRNIDTTLFPKKEFKGTLETVWGKEAIEKYGEKGRDGVVEIFFDKQKSKIIDTIPKVDTILWPKDYSKPAKKSPTTENLKTWQDSKMYGVWLDGKRITNSELGKYTPSDFDLYYVSKLEKNAVNYGKHYYEVCLYSPAYYKKNVNGVLIRETYLDDTTRPQKQEPLIVINGKVMAGLDSKKIDEVISPNDIESIHVLKDKTATDKYGEKGRNGVIEIKTKTKVANEITLTDKKNPLEDENVIFEKVEIEPAFKGGYKAWKEFCNANLNASIPIDNRAPEGTYMVVLRFIVDKDGNISDLQPLTNLGYGMEEESIRVMKLSPIWKPAIQNGYTVKAYRKQPFNFVVNKK